MHTYDPPPEKPSLMGLGAFMAFLAIVVILGFFYAADRIVKQALVPPQALIASPTPTPTPHVIVQPPAEAPSATPPAEGGNASATEPTPSPDAAIVPTSFAITPTPTPRVRPRLDVVYSRDSVQAILKEEAIGKLVRVRVGDFDADGRQDFVLFNGLSAQQAFSSGLKRLWGWENPPATATANAFDAPGVVWDLDNDRRAEVIALRVESPSNATLVIAQGTTGTALRKRQWPGGLDGGRISVAKPRGETWPNHVVVLAGQNSGARPGWNVTAYGPVFQPLWSFHKDGVDALARVLLVADFNNDKADEVFAGGVLLDATNGSYVWQRTGLGVVEAAVAADVDGDGVKEIVASLGGNGLIALRSSDGTTVWQKSNKKSSSLASGAFRSEPISFASGFNNSLELLDSTGGQWWFAEANDSVAAPRRPVACEYSEDTGKPLVLFGSRFYAGDGGESDVLAGSAVACVDFRGDDREEAFLFRSSEGLHYVEVLQNPAALAGRPGRSRDFDYFQRKAQEN